MAEIDTTTYDRPSRQTPSYGGFEVRAKPPTAIVVHSTSNPNHKNTAFSAEAKFLFVNKLAGAHYLIGKDGAAVRFFEPLKWAAWHAGNARAAYSNQRSIGIELHHSVGDPPYPKAQIDALGALLSSLSAQFNIPFGMVETHGQIAIAGPYDRKTDPSDWPHADFIRWRNTLVQEAPPPVSLPQPPPVKKFRLSVPCAPLTARSPSAPLAAGVVFAAGDVVNVGDEGSKDGWLWVSDTPDTAPGIGWIPAAYARPL